MHNNAGIQGPILNFPVKTFNEMYETVNFSQKIFTAQAIQRHGGVSSKDSEFPLFFLSYSHCDLQYSETEIFYKKKKKKKK